MIAISPVPVLAAGGVATAAGLAAVIATGAAGGWVGTPFAACVESDSAAVAKEAFATGKTLREVVLAKGLMDAAALDQALDPRTMTRSEPDRFRRNR